jgi:iron complex transport system ATP-binding protein
MSGRKKAVEVEDLSFSYNGREVLRGVTFSVDEGELLMILGPNGAGKSTLVKCIAGILRCKGVKVFGRDVRSYPRNELARVLAYVPQIAERSFLTVFDYVLLGRKPYIGFSPGEDDINAAMKAIERMGLTGLERKPLNRLSGGELQKASIARALAQEPRILIMDEPTNNLDLKSQLEVMKLARELTGEGKTVIMVMHDINMALRFGERFLFMKGGMIAGESKRGDLTPQLLEKIYGVKVAIREVMNAPVVVPLE